MSELAITVVGSSGMGDGVPQPLVAEGTPDPRFLCGEVDRVLAEVFDVGAAQRLLGSRQCDMEGPFGLKRLVTETIQLVPFADSVGPQLGGTGGQDPDPGLVHVVNVRVNDAALLHPKGKEIPSGFTIAAVGGEVVEGIRCLCRCGGLSRW